MNDRLFTIGIFPWFMILASTIFFPADWPNRMISVIRANRKNQGVLILLAAILFSFIGLYFHQRFELLPFVVAACGGAILVWTFIDSFSSQTKTKLENVPLFIFSKTIAGLICLWAIVQVVIPLRHFFIPGNVSWTEQGHRFSWHMKLRGKDGDVKFFAYDPKTGERYQINHKQYLRSWQYRKMSTRPYMILQFAKYLDQRLVEEGNGHFEIRVEAYARLNFRKYQQFINPDIDLARQTYSDFRHNDWIFQLDERLLPLPVSTKNPTGEMEE